MKAIKSRKARIFAVALLSILAASFTALAAIKYTATVTNQVTILGYELQLWRTDSSLQVTGINWGSLTQGISINTETLYGWGEYLPYALQLEVKNTGDYALKVSWNTTGLPTGVTITCDYWNTANWVPLAQNTDLLGDDTHTMGSPIAPGSFSDPVRFTLNIASDAPRGTYGNFSIQLFGNA